MGMIEPPNKFGLIFTCFTLPKPAFLSNLGPTQDGKLAPFELQPTVPGGGSPSLPSEARLLMGVPVLKWSKMSEPLERMPPGPP